MKKMIVSSSPLQCAALILAAGRGERAGSSETTSPKQYKYIAGLPLLCHAMHSFLTHPGIQQVRVVIHPREKLLYQEAIEKGRNVWQDSQWWECLLDPVVGGKSRQDSVRAGLESFERSPPDKVLIHDGVRPIITHEEIDDCLRALIHSHAAVPLLPLTDALKLYDIEGGLQNVPRESYRLALTPQGFNFAVLLESHRAFALERFPDDAALVERAGIPIKAISGKHSNFKVTYAEDFPRAESVLAQNSSARRSSTRIGWGYDVHPFIAGKSVRLCGVDIPHERSLAGHSDADVGLHALTDAILGAVAAGDIGENFPPTDPRWREVDSKVFLSHAAELVRRAGFCVDNVDITLICETPKIAPHRFAMRQAIAHILALAMESVSVKATTTEGLGFLGREEGIAAQAVASLSPLEQC